MSILYTYSLLIKENHLDAFGHVNNATYLTLFEEARWNFVTKNGYGMQKMIETGLGPVILEIKIRFLKELLLGDEMTIQTQLLSYKGKVGVIQQKMLRGTEICCEAEFTIGLFNLKDRKMITPTPEWLKAIGIDENSSNMHT